MIKAVFFDLYHTLVRYEPPREELLAGALKDFGIDVSPGVFRRPLVTADEFIHEEISRRPLRQRTQAEKMALYAQHQGKVLSEAGIEPSEKLVHGLLGKMQQLKMKLVLFDDVMTALKSVRERSLILGLISNVEHDITPTLVELGLVPWLDIVVTSQESGLVKPKPEIFLAAAKRAGVQPAEAIYVGDQYQVDYVGATQAGMKGILLDRYDYFKDKTDCPRIKSLSEIIPHLSV
jgi:putative hydrolase of the HAD superfamily